MSTVQPETTPVIQEPKRRTEDRIKDLDEKLDTILNRLATIETALASSPQSSELAPLLAGLRSGVTLYSEPLKAVKRLYEANRYLKTSSIEKDEISRLMLEAMVIRGRLNISQLEREVRGSRGKASRRTIRERLKRLVNEQIVEISATSPTRKYQLVQ